MLRREGRCAMETRIKVSVKELISEAEENIQSREKNRGRKKESLCNDCLFT